MIGDPMLFQRAIDIEAGWRVVDPILKAWREAGGRDLCTYPGGQRRAGSGAASCCHAAGNNGGRSHERRQPPQIRVFDTPEQFARAGRRLDRGARARRPAHRFALCLSGGTTPKRVYELLGEAPRRARLPWDRTHWFWGDERVVPHDDPRSNFHMASEALLRHAPVPAANIHAIPDGAGRSGRRSGRVRDHA